MSLLEAFILDPASLDVWVAARTDGVLGSGTEEDPFDGGVRATVSVSVSGIVASGSTATATATNHGFQNLQLIQISGVVAGAHGNDQSYYNGTFSIFGVMANTFQYLMWGMPPDSTAPAGAGGITAQPDPYFFDGVMRSLPIAITQLTSALNMGAYVATAYALYHGFSAGNIVTISGATGTDAHLYNGTFQITAASQKSFQYTLPPGTPSGAAQGSPYCRLNQFEAAGRSLVTAPPVAVRIGPGLFQTKGFAPNFGAAWVPRSGMKFFGSGMEVSVLQLVGANMDNSQAGGYAAISGSFDNFLDSAEAWDFTVDSNIAGQPSATTACGAVIIFGKHIRIRRIRAINWGTQNSGVECFVLATASAHPDNPEPFDCWIADCIMEQPGLNNVREATLMDLPAQQKAGSDIMKYHRACLERNCFVDCEFRQNPVPISAIVWLSGNNFQVTTRFPHGLSNGGWARISGATLTDTNNSFNGSYQITKIDDYNFQYTPNPSQPSTAAPSGEMWLGKFPNHDLQIQGAVPTHSSPYTVTITTMTPHFKLPGDTIFISGIGDTVHPQNSLVYNGLFQVTLVDGAFVLEYTLQANPPDVVSVVSAAIGTAFQAAEANGGTSTVFEGNRIVNCGIGGPYHDTWNSPDLIVRNNYYRAVGIGPYRSLKGVSFPPISLASLSYDLEDGIYVCTAGTSAPHGFVVGDAVQITTTDWPNLTNGNFQVVSVPNSTSLTFNTLSNPHPPDSSGSSPGTIARLFQDYRLVFENNIIDLIPTPANSAPPWGMQLGWLPSASPPLYLQVLARRNIIRHVDGSSDPAGMNQATAMNVYACSELIVEENVADLAVSNSFSFQFCGSVKYLANLTSAGALIQGYNWQTLSWNNELSNDIEDAALLAF